MDHQKTSKAGDELYELRLSTADLQEFLTRFAVSTVESLSTAQARLRCGITLMRPRKPVTVAADSDSARLLDEVQYAHAEGPCLEACQVATTILVDQVSTEQRWPAYMAAVAGNGVQSILAVPFELAGAGRAALNLYADAVGVFTPETISTAESFVHRASGALRLAVEVARHTDTAANLQAAMQSRTTIDLAAGMLMAQNRCSQEEAIAFLQRASNTRNRKMHDVAAAVIAGITAAAAETHFQD
jgi:hypothetical protein